MSFAYIYSRPATFLRLFRHSRKYALGDFSHKIIHKHIIALGKQIKICATFFRAELKNVHFVAIISSFIYSLQL